VYAYFVAIEPFQDHTLFRPQRQRVPKTFLRLEKGNSCLALISD